MFALICFNNLRCGIIFDRFFSLFISAFYTFDYSRVAFCFKITINDHYLKWLHSNVWFKTHTNNRNSFSVFDNRPDEKCNTACCAHQHVFYVLKNARFVSPPANWQHFERILMGLLSLPPQYHFFPTLHRFFSAFGCGSQKPGRTLGNVCRNK